MVQKHDLGLVYYVRLHAGRVQVALDVLRAHHIAVHIAPDLRLSHKMLALAACSALAPRLELLLLLQLCRLHGRSEEALCCDTQCSQHSASSKQWACHWTDNVQARLAKTSDRAWMTVWCGGCSGRQCWHRPLHTMLQSAQK